SPSSKTSGTKPCPTPSSTASPLRRIRQAGRAVGRRHRRKAAPAGPTGSGARMARRTASSIPRRIR
ncbi:hypothetical protein LTR53_006774, partial [Teratosphaeriaceae sp. CCFEE 6253]